MRVQTHTHTHPLGEWFLKKRETAKTYLIPLVCTDSHCTSPAAVGFVKTGICLGAAWPLALPHYATLLLSAPISSDL